MTGRVITRSPTGAVMVIASDTIYHDRTYLPYCLAWTGETAAC